MGGKTTNRSRTRFRHIGQTSMRPIMAKLTSARKLQVLLAVFLAIASSGCSQQGETKEAHLARAKDYAAAAQYDKAESEYREVLRVDPADAVALRDLGIMYQDQGQSPQAAPLLSKAAELLPDDPDLQVKFAQYLLLQGQYDQAREATLRALDKQPGREAALMLLTNTAVGLKDVGETRKLIQDLREKDQDRPGYHLALGMLALAQKDQARAESEFDAALELDPKSALAHSALANLYWARNDLKAAEQAFKAAADLASPASPSMRMQYADFKLRTGALPEAKNILENINAQTPSYLPASVGLMKLACAERNRNTEDCDAKTQIILARDTMNYDGLLQDGIRNIEKGDAGKAVRELEYLSSIYTRNAPVRFQLARAYLLLASKSTSVVDRRNAVERADTLLTDALKLDPNLDAATILLAEVKIGKRIPAAAVDLLTPLVKERPQMAQAHYLLATAYLAQQKASDALAVYRKMTELFPQDAQPFFNLGTLLLAQRQLPAARQAFQKAVEISPNALPAIERLVDIDLAEQQYAPAMDPKLAQAWALRGKIYLVQRDYTHAEADLSKAIELDPKLEPAYLLLTQLYVATNKQDQAIANLNAFVEKNKDVAALMQLGLLQESLKHFDAARDAYEQVLSVTPNFVAALNNLAMIYSGHLGQPEKAYDLAKKAVEIAPNEPHLADTLGWISFKKGNYSDAVRLLQDSAAKLPGQPEIEYHLGMAHYILGQEGPARTALQKAADASADFPGKDDARKRLSVLAIGIGAADV